MGVFLNCFVAALMVSCVRGWIIPDEITSLLSLIYSNIPPIKKGHDHRLGVGFSLGRHADAQVVLELGPQINTEPLSGASQRRRQASVRGSADKAVAPGRWLSTWSNALKPDSKLNNADRAPAQRRRVGERTRSTGDDVMAHLHQLYNNNNATSSTAATTPS